MLMKSILVAFFAIVSLAVRTAAADFIIMNSSDPPEWSLAGAGNYTSDGHGDPDAFQYNDYFTHPFIDGIASTGTVSAAGSTSTVTTLYQMTGPDSATFTTTYELTRAADAPYGNLTSAGGSMWFIPEEDMTYTIEGAFTNSNGYTQMGVTLFDRSGPPNAYLFTFSQQESASGTGATFVVTPTISPELGRADGYITGTLLKGNLYDFSRSVNAWSFPNGDDGGVASGYVRLTLTRAPAAVPEPASLTLLGFGVIGLTLIRRRGSAGKSCPACPL